MSQGQPNIALHVRLIHTRLSGFLWRGTPTQSLQAERDAVHNATSSLGGEVVLTSFSRRRNPTP